MDNQYTRFFKVVRRTYAKEVSLIILLSFIGRDTYAQTTSWKLEKEREGIQVYTREVSNSSYKAFKGIVEIQCSLEKLVEALKDFPSFSQWYYRLTKGEVLERSNENSGYCYTIMDLPWPATDRDNIFRYDWKWPSEHEAILTSFSVPEYVPNLEGFIRIPESTSTWHLLRLDRERVRLVHEAHADPGGELPAWLANNFVTEAPYSSLKKLKERLEQR